MLAPAEIAVKNDSRTQLSDDALLSQLKNSVSRDRRNTGELLADLAEVDARKLYLPAGFSSMFAYCVGELGLAEDSACKRIRAARAARDFPKIFSAVAEGGLSLSAVVLLAPYLTPGNVDELLQASSGKCRSEIETIIARHFPRSEELPMVESLPVSVGATDAASRVSDPIEVSAPGRINRAIHVARVAPVATERFSLHVSIGQSAHDKLRHAQALLGHEVPCGDLAAVLERVLDLAIRQLEKQKIGTTERPCVPRPSSNLNPRYIPHHVKRAVWQRDEGQCTFAGQRGHRCAEKRGLEFDHIEPVARGGRTTVENLRLRCRAHNQYEAERVLGTGFMNQKREAARRARERIEEVAHCLRQLRYRAHEARRAAEFSDSIPSAPLEERVKRALTWFAPRVTTVATGCGTSAFTIPGTHGAPANRPGVRL